MFDLIIHKKNESFLWLKGDDGIIQELSEHFSFYVPGYRFMAKFKNKLWDGKIKLVNTQSNTVYLGLFDYIIDFCKDRGYSYQADPQLLQKNTFTPETANAFIDALKMPFKIRDYQVSSFISSITDKRMLLLSPTGSGKSAILYLIVRYLQRFGNKRGLLIVPTVSLVSQMYKDFDDYSKEDNYNVKENIHKIYQGMDKNGEKIKLTLDNGSVFIFNSNENIKLINNTYKKAINLNERDEIDDKWLHAYKEE